MAALGQTHRLLGQCVGLVRVWAQVVEPPQSKQRGEEVRCFPPLLAQLENPVVGVAHLGCGMSLEDLEWDS